MTKCRWHVFKDLESLSIEAGKQILMLSHRAIDARGLFKIVLTGGRTPNRIYQLLAGSDADWPRWVIYFSDERCLPPDHADRNSVMAARAWLDHVTIPTGNTHTIPAEQGSNKAAHLYSEVLYQARPFDLVLLGMGEDGHIASLFPGQSHDAAELVHPVHDAPKPPPDRVTLGVNTLNDTNSLMVLIAGATKREAVIRWQQGESIPVASAGGRAGCDVYIDEAANPE